MLAYVLAMVVGLGSFALYMAAFFFPEVHRKHDFIWSGVGLFYALVLWVCADRITGGVLLGQTASVTLLGWLGWQTLTLRRQSAPLGEQTPIPTATELRQVVGKLSQSQPWSNLSDQAAKQLQTFRTRTQEFTSTISSKPEPTAEPPAYVPLTRNDFGPTLEPETAVDVEFKQNGEGGFDVVNVSKPGSTQSSQLEPARAVTHTGVKEQAIALVGTVTGLIKGLGQKKSKPTYVRKQFRTDTKDNAVTEQPAIEDGMGETAPVIPASTIPTIELVTEPLESDSTPDIETPPAAIITPTELAAAEPSETTTEAEVEIQAEPVDVLEVLDGDSVEVSDSEVDIALENLLQTNVLETPDETTTEDDIAIALENDLFTAPEPGLAEEAAEISLAEELDTDLPEGAIVAIETAADQPIELAASELETLPFDELEDHSAVSLSGANSTADLEEDAVETPVDHLDMAPVEQPEIMAEVADVEDHFPVGQDPEPSEAIVDLENPFAGAEVSAEISNLFVEQAEVPADQALPVEASLNVDSITGDRTLDIKPATIDEEAAALPEGFIHDLLAETEAESEPIAKLDVVASLDEVLVDAPDQAPLSLEDAFPPSPEEIEAAIEIAHSSSDSNLTTAPPQPEEFIDLNNLDFSKLENSFAEIPHDTLDIDELFQDPPADQLTIDLTPLLEDELGEIDLPPSD